MSFIINTPTSYICTTEPAYAGQEALSINEVREFNFPEDTKIYYHAIVEIEHKMYSATTCTYSLVMGKDSVKELFRAKKASAVSFFCDVPAG